MLRIRNHLSIIEFVKRSSKRFSVMNIKEKDKNIQDDDSFMLNHSHLFLNENFNEIFKPLDQKQNPSIMDQIDYNISSTDKLLFPQDYSDLIEKDKLYKEEEVQNSIKVNDSNFKNLYDQCYNCVKYLHQYRQDIIEKLCENYIQNAFESNDKKVSSFEAVLNEVILYNSQYELDSNHDTNIISLQAKNITISFNIIYEFIDRGMKGLLTGDITSNLILNLKPIFEKYLKDIQQIEEELQYLGINANDFYDSCFKIDVNFMKRNTPRNISVNLSKHFERQGIQTRKLLYYVNLNHINYADLNNNFNADINKEDFSKEELERFTTIINNKKQFLSAIFNEMYNHIVETTIINQLKTPFYGIPFPNNENINNLFRRQLFIEEGCFQSANDDFNKIFSSLQSIEKAHELFFNRNLLTDWHYNFNFSIAESQKQIIQNEEFKKPNNLYLQYFISLSSDEISMLCLLQLLKLIINNLSISRQDDQDNLLNALGKNSAPDEDEMLIIDIPLTQFCDEIGTLFIIEMKNTKVNHNFHNDNARFYLKNINHKMVNYEISKSEKIKLGMFLAHLLQRNIKFESPNSPTTVLKKNVLSFNKQKVDGVKFRNVISINKEFVEKYYSDLQRTFSLNIQIQKALPMIYKPMTWKNYRIGCYYLRQTPFSKIPIDHVKTCKLYEHNDISRVIKCLDLLGEVKWRINQKVLDVIEYIWSTGGGVGEIPQRYNDRVISRNIIRETKDYTDKLQLLKESQHNRELHSLRCDFMIKLTIARNFAKCKEIYFPHNIDYRGRAYPISPHLNHIGNDLCRGLLEYSEKKPLGKEGLNWLKIHMANVIGKDKLTIEGRIKYTESVLDMIHKCAKDPYKNLEWLETENPWQAIATMFELSNALKSSNPEEYRTNLHVHVDGSCNGLQHYTALSRDKKGGYEVGLMDRNSPGDVYTKVLEIVLEKLGTEKNENDKKYSEMLLKEAIVTRKVIKQTVMTSVYGVTLIGARDQIKKQLKDKKLFDPQTLFYVSMYLAKKTIESIGDLFKEANAIKAWLTKCALIISHGGYQVNWITPLGLPCVQPYKKLTETDLITTHAQGVTIISNYDKQPVNKRKQGTAFPPNYIHSLDSAHMMYTVLEAQKHEITFSSVHDSYWCHPSDLDKLNKILRKEFVNLHSQPLLETLLKNFKLSYPELKFPDIPNRGELELNDVLKSTYFFS